MTYADVWLCNIEIKGTKEDKEGEKICYNTSPKKTYK